MPRTRFDGRLAQPILPYRRIMPFLMRGRTESAVYFEQVISLARARPRLAELEHETGTRIMPFHLLLWAIGRTLAERPRLNRFLAGHRLYDREGVFLSFSVKRRMHVDAPVVLVKRRFRPDESLCMLAAALRDQIAQARERGDHTVDREIDYLLKLPGPLLSGGVRLVRMLDALNLAPRALIEHDPLYTSAVVSNLGSLSMDAAYHHLYEYGNCPLFFCMGLVRDGDGSVAGPAMRLCITYDERIEDGYYCARALELLRRYLEEPDTWLV